MPTSDKQQQITTEEGCVTGSNSLQLTGNGDITQQQHPPPLQVHYKLIMIFYVYCHGAS